MQLAAAPVSYSQELVTPCTFIVINGLFAAFESNAEQMFDLEKVDIASEQRDKIVFINVIFARCFDLYKLGDELQALG
jgi:hypothetical protein